jgi:hydroxyacylglutathione hydrolase
VSVSLTSRGGATDRLEVGRVINCTGAEASLSKLPNPLIRSMLRDGAMVEHPLRTGVLVTRDGALIGRDGRVSDRVFTMGPLRIGTLIESVAIPEIREQAREVADRLGARPCRTPEVTSTPVLAGTARR